MNKFRCLSYGVVSVLLTVMTAGCNRDDRQLRVGFIGGLSNRNLDVGESGYRAVMLAVEQVNRNGGINGRLVVLDPRDDSQNRETAVKAATELAAAKVEAVIGPFTSGMAAAVVPTFEKAGILVISPTISGMNFYGKDDCLVRINRTTRDNAGDYARLLHSRGQHRIAIALDTGNRAFTESWYNEFRAAMTTIGGTTLDKIDYESGDSTDYAAVVQAMLKSHPDGLLFISGALDVARLAQQARSLAPHLPISAVEWAASEQLLELGGKVLEGLLIIQNFNREETNPRYLAFREAYFRRYQVNPGYSSVMAYDAATVLFEALRKKTARQSPKQAVLTNGPYQGLDQTISFDANGDTNRQVYFTEIRNGMFRILK